MRPTLRAVFLALTLGFGMQAMAGPLEEGAAAHNRGDYATALSWYRRAADQGDETAQFILGVMYSKGQGVPQDYATALSWYRRAAEQGNVGAEFILGVMYSKGQGVPQDYVLAHKWLNLAASRFPASEKEERDIAVKLRDQIASKMTAAQIDEAEKLTRDWQPKPER